jgi:hypothetical protein
MTQTKGDILVIQTGGWVRRKQLHAIKFLTVETLLRIPVGAMESNFRMGQGSRWTVGPVVVVAAAAAVIVVAAAVVVGVLPTEKW